MDSIKNLINKISAVVNNHIRDVAAKLKSGEGNFFELDIVKILSKFFVDLLTFIATLYELIRYIMSYHTNFVTATS